MSSTPPPPPPAPSAARGRRTVSAVTGRLGGGSPGRRRLVRTADDRIVAGVAGGLGRLLGVDPVLVRIGFVVLTMAGGVGLVAYGALWALTPATADGPARPRRPTVQQAVALSCITLGALLLLRRWGLWFGDALVWPVVVAAAGSAIVWTRGEDARGASRTAARWTAQLEGRAGPAPETSWSRVAVGTLLVALAVIGFLAGNVALVAVRELGLAVLAATAGTLLLFGPWFSRVFNDLSSERRERVRQEERAELAAHLHDSVLQTLALIQRTDDPRRMVTLARVQERELRGWLYGAGRTPDGGPARTLAAAVDALATELEARDHLAIDVVVVGDAPVDARTDALLGAVREALTNVAKHADVTAADVYVEVEEDATVRAYVRDRGRGFEPAAVEQVDDHRRGLRDSVRGRLHRVDGEATVRSSPGAGTEVELVLPHADDAADPEARP